jgi:hypothetical protein
MFAKYHVFILLLIFTIPSFAQLPDDTSYWKREGLVNLAITQAGFKNWQGGGENAIALNSRFSYRINYEKEVITWLNAIDAGYGITRFEAGEALYRKSDDGFSILSKIGRNISENFNASALVDFRSQFANGYQYVKDTLGIERKILVSEFMSPAYALFSIGAEYQPSENIFVFLSPVTAKTTFVLNDSFAALGSYGVEPGNNFRTELGAHLNGKLRTEIMENITFETSLLLFSGYEQIRHIDVDWENILSLKVNRYISALLTTNLLYDKDIDLVRDDGTRGEGVQFKEVFNLGLKYEF